MNQGKDNVLFVWISNSARSRMARLGLDISSQRAKDLAREVSPTFPGAGRATPNAPASPSHSTNRETNP